MSRIVEVFVGKPGGSLEEFAAEVSKVTGIPLVFDGDDNFINANEERIVYAHLSDCPEDDLGIPFSKYPLAVSVRGKPASAQDAAVAHIFGALKAKTSYPLLVVEECEKILNRRD